MRPARTANWNIANLCLNDEHDIRKSAEKCGNCQAILCAICGTDYHYTGDGHDLNLPQYWGI